MKQKKTKTEVHAQTKCMTSQPGYKIQINVDCPDCDLQLLLHSKNKMESSCFYANLKVAPYLLPAERLSLTYSPLSSLLSSLLVSSLLPFHLVSCFLFSSVLVPFVFAPGFVPLPSLLVPCFLVCPLLEFSRPWRPAPALCTPSWQFCPGRAQFGPGGAGRGSGRPESPPGA